MKRITLYFFGILTMTLMCAALFVAGAIYDAWNKSVTETYFFQPDNLSSRRPGVPATPADLGDSKMREFLVQKFVTEYFYVWPDDDNIEMRAGKNGVLSLLSSVPVLQYWRENMAPEIQKMSNNRMFRTVTVDTKKIIKPVESDYWSVEYELKTWDRSNDTNMAPEIQRGKMYLKIAYETGIRDSIIERGIHNVLDAGNDPVVLFKFRVTDIIQE